jgi:hypothetical protein
VYLNARFCPQVTTTEPGAVNCVEATAATTTCTAVGQELYTLTTVASNGGTNCSGSSTLCVAGDIPVNCVEATAATTTCTAVGQELYTLTTAASNGGTACSGSSTLCVASNMVVADRFGPLTLASATGDSTAVLCLVDPTAQLTPPPCGKEPCSQPSRTARATQTAPAFS